MPLPPMRHAEYLIIDCRAPNASGAGKQLDAAVSLALDHGAAICGLAGWTARAGRLPSSPLLVGGQRYLLACLPGLLDCALPGWRLCHWAVSLDDPFAVLLARWLAREVRALYLRGEGAGRLAALIYRECGMLCRISPPPPHAYLALTPGQKYDERKNGEKIEYWQGWPSSVHLNTSENPCSIPVGWAEALLIADRCRADYQRWRRLDLWSQIDELRQRMTDGRW